MRQLTTLEHQKSAQKSADLLRKAFPWGKVATLLGGRMRDGRGCQRSTDQSLPLEGGAPRSESKIYMTAGGSHTSTTVVRLKPDRMRSKVTASYRPMVMIGSFDLISQP